MRYILIHDESSDDGRVVNTMQVWMCVMKCDEMIGDVHFKLYHDVLVNSFEVVSHHVSSAMWVIYA